MIGRILRARHRHVLQALLATAVLAAILMVEDSLSNAAIVTAVASSAFTVFVSPGAPASAPRRMLGGHSIAVAAGLAGTVLLRDVMSAGFVTSLETNCVIALVVGFTMVGMVLTDTEHAPAAGTALGVVLSTQPVASSIYVLVAAVLLASVRALFGDRLIDMTQNETRDEVKR